MTNYRKLTICLLRVIGVSVLLYAGISLLFVSISSRSNMAGLALGALLPVIAFGAILHFAASPLSRVITAGLDEE